jgi:hypothetical protein
MMWGVWLGAMVAVAGFSAPGKTADQPNHGSVAEDKDLFAEPSVQWLKVYQLPINREIWRLEGSVKSLEQDLPKVREAFSGVGAALAGAEASSGKTRRLSYRCPKESAKRALAELRKLGSFGEPAVRELVEPVSRAEVQGKVQALEADKAVHAEELAKMPAVSALVEELLGHLHGVEAALDKPEVEVLVHLSIKEKG